MVRAAYSAGKPALGVGRGQRARLHRATAKLKRAVNDIVLSKSFDNGMICASEQAVILDAAIYDAAHGGVRARCTPTVATAGGEGSCWSSSSSASRRTAQLRRAKLNAGRRRPDRRRGSPSRPGFTVPAGHLDHPGRGRPGRPGRAADPGEARARCWPCCAPTAREQGLRLRRADGRVRRARATAPSSTPPTTRPGRGVRHAGQGGPDHLELAGLAGRHRRHLQRVPAVADARAAAATATTRCPTTSRR